MFGLENLGLIGLFIGTFLAATIVPFSSDALYVAVLTLSESGPIIVLIVATLGNWLGGVTTYFLGRCASWDWICRVFRVKRETLEHQKVRIDKYGIWMALLSWVPVIGDVINIALGVYKTPAVPTLILLLIGKFARFAVWTALIIYGAQLIR